VSNQKEKPSQNPSDESAAEDPRILELAREYLAEWELGKTPQRKSYFDRHPDITGLLSDFFDGIDLAHAAGRMGQSSEESSKEGLPREPLGDFKIVREIGRGGMGVVYEAVQLSLGRRVALKVLPFAAALNAKQLQRFQTEAHAAAQLHHTNIVPVHAVGCDRGVHYYAMQVIDGRPLDAVIKELRVEAPTSPLSHTVDLKSSSTILPNSVHNTSRSIRPIDNHRAMARLGLQIAEALEYAHEAGVVHRDIKPANLLLDGKGNAWITDFGLAQVSTDTGLTQTGDIFGTLRYMSPEQAAGRRLEVDHRTDIYSLGATLYELLCHEPAFPGQDRQRLLNKILHEEPLPLRAIDKSIPEEIETIILKAMAKIPIERYTNAANLAEDLRRFLENRPILAQRPSLIDHGRKWIRRHPSVVWATVVVLFISVVVLGISTTLVIRQQALTQTALEREKDRALEANQRFDLARRSVDELIEVAEEELATIHPLEGVRRRLLETALAYYQEFIEMRRDDPASQTELSLTRDRVRRILEDLAVLQGDRNLFLLNSPVVLEQLHLSESQGLAIRELGGHLGNRREESFRDFGKLSGEERKQRFLEMAKARDSSLQTILRPDQLGRFRQLALQSQGPMAFLQADVILTLAITNEQKDKIRSLMEGGPMGFGQPPPEILGVGPRLLLGSGFGPPHPPFGEFKGGPKGAPPPKGDPSLKGDPFRSPRDEMRRSIMVQIRSLLSKEQQVKWSEMTGNLVNLPGQMPFRNGPPGPRPGGFRE